jgi:biotin synthase
VENEAILALEEVVEAAKAAKASGASRFCMGAAWRRPKQKDLDLVKEMIKEVKNLGLESCATLGMLDEDQTKQLKNVGLDYYNHNLDTSPEFYGDIITTRTYQDRLDTLKNVRNSGINVCCGGIVGMGEGLDERVGLLYELANLSPQPESVPINLLTQVEGTPLHGKEELDHFEFVRTIAVARIIMPKSFVRLSAGRESMDESTQALAFIAGANSIFYGDELLTTENPSAEKDQKLMQKLGITTE